MQSSDVEKVLRNLAVVASLSANDKLMTEDDHFSVQGPTSFFGWMQRKWYRESRDINLHRVATTMRAAKSFIGNAQRQTTLTGRDTDLAWVEHVQTCRRMREVLSKSLGGLRQQRSTYKDDALHVAKIDTLLNEMEDFFVALSYLDRQPDEEERQGRLPAITG